jgi:tetratricopeptide (TPR) repeat protein
MSVSFSPDSRRLASASYDGTVKVWDVATGQETATLEQHTDGVWSVCFSPDGGRLAAACSDKTVKVWDGRPSAEVLTLQGPPARVTSVGFSWDGRRIVARGGDIAKAWDTTSGLAVEPCPDPPPPPDQRLAQSPDGTMTAWANGTRVQVLRTEEWKQGKKADSELVLAWHLRQAHESEEARDWFATAFHLVRLLRAYPRNANYHTRHGRALAELSRWREAAEAFGQVGELDAGDAWHLHRQAWALLAGGDHQGYRQACTRLLKEFGDEPDVVAADIIAYTSALTADSGIDSVHLAERASVIVKSVPKSDFHLRVMGGALYRAVDYKRAVVCLERAAALHGKGGTAWMHLFLAMAHHRLGHADKARHWLAVYDREGWNNRAGALLGASSSGPLPAVAVLAVPTIEWPDASDFWEVRLARQLLRREAEAVLREKPGAAP